MSRPQKTGLDYFPVVTEWDQKIRLVKAKYKLLGVGCILELWRAIYREGYALPWNEDAELLFADENSMDIGTLREIIQFAIDRGIFSKEKHAEAHVLTSHGIQKQWLGVALESHRKNAEIDPELCLLSPEELSGNKVASESSGGGVSSGGNEAGAGFPPGEMPQSKAKQSKANSKELASAREGPPVDKSEEDSLRSFCEARAKATKNVKNLAALVATLATKPDVIADWRAGLANPPPPPPPKLPPHPDPCPVCGGKTIAPTPGPGQNPEAYCNGCKTSWTYNDFSEEWDRDPEPMRPLPSLKRTG